MGNIPFRLVRQKISVRLAFAVAVLLVAGAPAQSEYRLESGDMLEISAAGLPDLKQRVMVQPDGTIAFPLLGSILVAGLAPSEARARIQAALGAKVFRQKAADGRESVVIIDPDQVTATLAEFRPIFVNGDVSKPGQQVYRPSMTVREAVALSGGYDSMRFRMERNPFLQSADLRSEFDEQWTEFVKEQAAIGRIRAELGRQSNVDQTRLMEAPIRRSTIAEIISLESEQLETRQADFEREKVYIQGAIAQTESHIKVVSEQLEKDDQGLQADAQDLARISDLFGRGAVAIPRVTDARRALLWTSTRKLETASQLMKLQTQRLDLTRQLERIDAQRKSDLLRELQDRNVRVSEIRSKLQSIDEKLQYTGTVKSQLVRGKGGKPDILVVRKGENGRTHIGADEDFELEPGDVVEVSLREPPADLSAR
jgi:polysaccharide export outer membrane protein